MRKKTVQVLLGAALIAAMCLGAPTAAFADETTTKEETAEKTGDKDSAEEKERHDGGNNARIYGAEYWRLEDGIHKILEQEDSDNTK